MKKPSLLYWCLWLLFNIICLIFLVFKNQYFSIYSLNLMTSLIILILFLSKTYKDPFQPFNWIILSYFLYVIFPSIYIIFNNYNIYGLEAFSNNEIKVIFSISLLYLSIGLISFSIGYFLFRFKKTYMKKDFFLEELNLSKTILINFLLITLGMIGYILLSNSIGSGMRSNLAKGGDKYLFLLVLLLRLGIIVWFADLLKKRKRGSIFFFITLLIVLYIYFTLGGRGRLLSILIIMVMLYNYLYKKISITKIILIIFSLLILVLVIFPILSGGISSSNVSLIEKLYSGRNFDLIHNFALIVGRQNEIGLHFGKTIVGDLLDDIPVLNSIFNSSRYVFMNTFFPEVYQKGVGFPASFPGVLFFNFGLFGIILGMFFYGVMSKFIYEYFLFHQNNTSYIIIYVFVLSKLGIGGWLPLLPRDIIQIILLIFILKFIDSKNLVRINFK